MEEDNTYRLKNWYDRKPSERDSDIQESLDLLMKSEQHFWAFLPQMSRGKTYKNRGHFVPDGELEELDVTERREDSRRIIVDKNNLTVYVTLCHYLPDTFYRVGKVGEFG